MKVKKMSGSLADCMGNLDELTEKLDDIEVIDEDKPESISGKSVNGILMSELELCDVLKDMAYATWREVKRFSQADVNKLDMEDDFGRINKYLQPLKLKLYESYRDSEREIDANRVGYLVDIEEYLTNMVGLVKSKTEEGEFYPPRLLVATLFPFWVGINDFAEGRKISELLKTGKYKQNNFERVQKKVERAVNKIGEKGKRVSSKSFGTKHYTFHILNLKYPIEPINNETVLEAHYDLWNKLKKNSIELYMDSINTALEISNTTELQEASYPLVLSYAIKNLDTVSPNQEKMIV